MTDQSSNKNFSEKEIKEYAEEAEKRWGQTEIFKQSQERVKKMGKAGLEKVIKEASDLTQEIAVQMIKGEDPKNENVQKLIAKHYNGLRAFYEPNLKIYRNMAKMYIDDPRFKANYENVAQGLAQFMHDGMIFFADTQKNDNI
jgi:hypothetical protein